MSFPYLVRMLVLVGISLSAMEQPPATEVESIVQEMQRIQSPQLRIKVKYYLALDPLPAQMSRISFYGIRKLCIEPKYVPLLSELLKVKNGVRKLDPNSRFDETCRHFRLLSEAIYNKAYSNVKVLLDAGADPNCVTCDMSKSFAFHASPLFTAIDCKDFNLLRLLLNNRADPNKHYESYDNLPLMRVVQNYLYTDPEGRDAEVTTSLISLLLEYGANPDEKQHNSLLKSENVPECRDDDYKKYYTARALAQAHKADEILKLFNEKRVQKLV